MLVDLREAEVATADVASLADEQLMLEGHGPAPLRQTRAAELPTPDLAALAQAQQGRAQQAANDPQVT
jgi:hypothetical protein